MSYRCTSCGKGRVISTVGKHKRGVAGGQWKKKAPKTRKIFKPNLHRFEKKWYCTKCLRRVKKGKREVGETGKTKTETRQEELQTPDSLKG